MMITGAMMVTGVLSLLALVILVSLIWRPKWTGFAEKTLWDWLGLLSVPVLIGVLSIGFNQMQSERELQRAQETAVQSFISQITDLMLLDAPEDVINPIGRAHTTAVLRLVDGERAGRIIQFLEDLGVVTRFGVIAEELDLRGTELKHASLPGFDFEGSDLRDADLEGSDLRGADFERTRLNRADFKNADLRHADLTGASLEGADLDHTDLRAAILTGATGLTAAQLRMACTNEETLLPAGIARADVTPRGCDGWADD
ncbi:hypothetical protein FHS89_001859 [Rubricella aquisinus]|uniref:Pentapeptide repeat-containing protein n=1 Tax=Rubricella aquisinus TaxID=2028108 RepID=A0A840WLA7_9RHOB|nr:pentapeptide repeat-containing protein [Rubricella aquisinus]MBB5515839.1 hypothetical protein [Rubricella aquisinus]